MTRLFTATFAVAALAVMTWGVVSLFVTPAPAAVPGQGPPGPEGPAGPKGDRGATGPKGSWG